MGRNKVGQLCKYCEVYPVLKHHTRDGVDYYRSECEHCHRKKHTRNKKNYCELCGFVAKHRCQLDIDHIDGNHKNNDESNLQTLCANCHRLKTRIQINENKED